MKNGTYMKQEWDGSLEKVRIDTVNNPINASLIKWKNDADRVLLEILNGSTYLLVLYDDNNPPVEVVEIKIKVEFV